MYETGIIIATSGGILCRMPGIKQYLVLRLDGRVAKLTTTTPAPNQAAISWRAASGTSKDQCQAGAAARDQVLNRRIHDTARETAVVRSRFDLGPLVTCVCPCPCNIGGRSTRNVVCPPELEKTIMNSQSKLQAFCQLVMAVPFLVLMLAGLFLAGTNLIVLLLR
jgi:hypothetical protein